ncbi:MAG: metallophosphoesterase [Syntrophales bacterium]|nr:metallophosphoesterase [Syntrophales bacterium]MDD5640839.1 metallophosphoesterase [Syntrophales bacterium]
MLVLLSDIHLTDGTSGTTINPRAFQKFGNILLDIIGENKPPLPPVEKIELVLLGDIFDVIRSEVWLDQKTQKPKQPIRPWSAPDEVDGNGANLEDYTKRIVNGIINNPENIKIMGYLEEFQKECKEKKVNAVKFTYLAGNHDWLINRFPSTRLAIAKFLRMPDWEYYEKNPFPLYQKFPLYGVMARHGDCYDPLNYSGDRNASSLGDALVIDLLNHFPQEVKEDLEKAWVEPDVVESIYRQLKEIDNVRPLLEIPAWIKSVCRYYPDREGTIHDVWNRLAAQFFQIPYVQDFVRTNWFLGKLLKLALRLTSGISFSGLTAILAGKTIRRWYQNANDYKAYAMKEPALKDERVKYVVYGHTHYADQVPLDVAPIKNQLNEGKEKIRETLDRLYFNSGTWRRVYEHTASDWFNCEFIGWHVLTFLIFYLKNEKEPDRNYEEWSASLGYGR